LSLYDHWQAYTTENVQKKCHDHGLEKHGKILVRNSDWKLTRRIRLMLNKTELKES